MICSSRLLLLRMERVFKVLANRCLYHSGCVQLGNLKISSRTQNLKTDFVADFTNWESISGGISISGIRDKIRVQILCSTGNPKKSEFPSRTRATGIA